MFKFKVVIEIKFKMKIVLYGMNFFCKRVIKINYKYFEFIVVGLYKYRVK